MKIKNKEFDFLNNSYIMGILNVTPDSFSDGGKWKNIDNALYHVEEMINEGASIIDIGGESTKPGYKMITHEEEISRVSPYVRAINERFSIAISIDTYKAEVARTLILEGADMVNDIWGFKADKEMAKVVAQYQVPCCVMHNRDLKINPYKSVVDDVISDLRESINIGLEAGVMIENIITDPGIGFGKSQNDNLVVMNNVGRLKELGCPILLGTSRKSMIGLALDLPVEERLEGTIATTVLGIMKGCSIIRVHDVKQNYRAMKMTRAIIEV